MSSSLFFRSSAKFTARTNPLTQAFNTKTNTKNFVRTFSNSKIKMGVHNIASKAEFDAALKEHKVVVLDAFATWCGPCKVIAPTVATFSEKYTGAHFIKVDVDEVPDVAQELSIRAMPTFIVFKDGEKVQEIVGANPKALLAAVEAHAPEVTKAE